MAFRRFYLDKKHLKNEEEIAIEGDLFHHIRDVCRFKAGDRFEILAGDPRALLFEITSMEKRGLTAKKISERPLPAPEKPAVILALSVPKLPKVDWIIEKCVELGVAEIRPFVSDFSFLRKTSEISEARVSRWQKLIESATQQSGRGDLMRIHPAQTLEQILANFNRNGDTAGLFPYEGEAQLRLKEAVSKAKAKNPERLFLFVGSEGGFSPREVELFAQTGLKPVSMGQQILRVETACLALVSVIKYEWGALT